MIRLKQLREKKGLNMRQTALKLNIPYTTYISYEKGDREPNSEMLIDLADFFNCSIDYLLGRSESQIDDKVLEKVNDLDIDLLEQYGNIFEASKAQSEKEYNNDDFFIKYRELDAFGKRAVDEILNIEYERCMSLKSSELTPETNAQTAEKSHFPMDPDSIKKKLNRLK